MQKQFIFFFLLLLLIPFSNAKSQKVKSNDLQLWAAFELEFKLFSGLSLQLSDEMRFEKNIDQLDCNLLDVGLQYRITDFLKLSAAYKLKSRRDNTNDDVYLIAATTAFNIDRFNLNYRIRYENEPYKENEKENNIRNRLGAQYNIKDFPLSPFVSGEIFYRFNYDKGDRFNRYKLRFGIEYEPFKNQKIDLDYTYDSEFNMKKIDIKRIIGITYSIDIDCLNF